MQPDLNTQQKNQKEKKRKNQVLLLLLVILLLIVGFISDGMFSFLFRNTINRNTLLSTPIPLQANIPTDITIEDEIETVIPDEPEREVIPLIAATSRIRPLTSVPSQLAPIINTSPIINPPTPVIPNAPGPIIVTATLGQCSVICASINTSIVSGTPLILEQGIVYDTNPNPTIEDIKIIHSGNQLSYNSEIQNMRIINTYYIRSYVITPSGITYSNQIEINKPLSTPNNSEPTNIEEVFVNLKGNGTARSPYIITNDWELQAMSQDLDAHYRLGNNIDARGTENWNEGKGFTPIGGDGSTAGDPWSFTYNADGSFTGNFDGNGYGILGLTIDREGSPFNDGFNYYVGLFSRTDGAKLYNIVLQDHYILGKRFVGGIVGYAGGGTEIRNAVVDGVSWARLGFYGGGLIGWMDNGIIDNSIVRGKVHGSGTIIGGLVGSMKNGIISNSTSNADVDGGSSIGGLVGSMENGEITNSCTNGNVTVVYEPGFKSGGIGGGFVGGMGGGVIRNSYATGNISVDRDGGGGFVGSMAGGAINNSYAAGNVSVSFDRAGGFVGSLSGSNSSIMNSYSAGDVFIGGKRWGGGFVGVIGGVNPNISLGSNNITPINIADMANEIGIHNSYAIGDVIFTNYGIPESFLAVDTTIPFTPEDLASDGESFGGFVGENTDSVLRNNYSTGRVIYDSPGFINPTDKGFTGKITPVILIEEDMNLINTNNYWDINTSQQSSSAGNAIGLTTSQMYQQNSFNTWNFNTVWQSNGMSYPTLRNGANCKFTCFKPTPVIPLPQQPIDCINPPITNGLIQYLDVCSSSYVEEGTDIWRDLSPNNLDVPLIPEIAYNNIGGDSLIFNNLTGAFSSQLDIGNDLANSTQMTWVKPVMDENTNSLLYTQSYDQLNSFYSDLYLDETGILNLNTGSAIWNESITDYDYIDNPYNLGVTLESDKWYHIAITKTNNGPIRVYINQQLVFTSPDNHSFTLTNPPTTISSTYINRGNISHISVYDRPLSLNEIQQFFNSTRSKFTNIGAVINDL